TRARSASARSRRWRATALLARDTAEAAGVEAATTLARAEREREAAAAARDTAQSARATAQAAFAGLEAEARALTRALDSGGGGDRALARITASPGYEHALAAALGDDIDAAIGPAGKRRWAGSAADAGDPALPPGMARLADHVSAPPELARRLAQVGVTDSDDGTIALAVGQRLVTRTGRVRRWGGFVAEDVGAAAAERLVRVNRLATLNARLAPARAAVDEAAAAFAGAGAALDRAQGEIAATRVRVVAAEAAARRARQDEDAASVALERLSARREAVAERAARAGADHAEAATQDIRAREAAAALPDGVATRAAVEALRQVAEAGRSALAEARAQAAALAQAIEADRRRQEAARAEAKGWRARAGDAARRVAEMAARAESVAGEISRLADRPALLDTRIAEGTERNTALAAAAAGARAAEQAAEQAARLAERALADAAEALATAREARAGAAARQESHQARRVEASRVSGERFQCPAVVLPERIGFIAADVSPPAEEAARLDRLGADRERLGPVNLVAAQELGEVDAARDTAARERAELGEAIARLRGSIGSLNREGRMRLLAAFEAVDGHFRRLFTTLFVGGEAHLALVDSDDPLEAGLEIMAQPPGKKLATLTLLSGGEQALTAVALIFALFLTNPAPICVLDEVDAPLDDANIERFCDLLDRMVADTQTRYLIVTHNAVTMARMHRLFGVTMVERGISRLVSVDLGGAERLLAQ
ncbi:chromosome segregation protein, partial [Sphingomonas solaris]